MIRAAVVLCFGMFLFLSYFVYFADSEIWSVNIAYHFAEDVKHYWVNSRPLFYFLGYLSQYFVVDPVHDLRFTRLLMVAVSLITLFLVFKITSRISKKNELGFFSVLLLLSNTGFLNQGFRYRSDLLAGCIALGCLYGFLFLKRKRWTWLTVFLPLLATPKGILFSVGQGLSFEKIDRKHFGKIFLGLGAIILLSLPWTLNYLSWLFHYAKHSFSGDWQAPPYFSWTAFKFVALQFGRNPLFWLLVSAAFFYRKKADKKFEVPVLKLTAFLFLCLLTFPEKLPFFIASLLPFFSVTAALALPKIEKNIPQFEKRKGFAMICLALVGSASYWTYRNYLYNNNREQVAVIRELNEYYIRHKTRWVFDGMGLVPGYSIYRHFSGPHEKPDLKSLISSFEIDPPDLILMSQKTVMLGPEFQDYAERNYISKGQGIYMRLKELPAPALSTKKSVQELFNFDYSF
jgi:hypothetical protein